MSHYDILGISKTATGEEIVRGYKNMALKWHPDKNIINKEKCEEMFKKISHAYTVLKDEYKRRVYDRFNEKTIKYEGATSTRNFRDMSRFDEMSGFGGSPRFISTAKFYKDYYATLTKPRKGQKPYSKEMLNLVESLKPFEKVDITNAVEVEAAFKEMVKINLLNKRTYHERVFRGYN
jgi:DnaJ-class molecular chaperone